MALTVHPEIGTVLICNYDSGFRAPEMTKIRLCVVVSPRLKRRDNLCTVVPLSTTAPEPVEEYHHLVTLPRDIHKYEGREKWAKCDMLATVSFSRLTMPYEQRVAYDSGRKFISMRLNDDDLQGVRNCVRRALGFDVEN